MAYYAPLDILKPIGDDIWIVDGPDIRFFGLPYSTRMTVIRLQNGDLFLHSPTHLAPGLKSAIDELGPVRHLVSPNWIHYAYIADWAKCYPDAIAWASPNVRARATKQRADVRFDVDLAADAPDEWAGEIDQMIVEGSKAHREVVFFHRRSGVLILTDLIESFEPAALPLWFRPIAAIAGILDPDGKMPVDMWLTFKKRKQELKACVERMVGWAPAYIVIAHGRCYDKDCVAELRRAFRKAL